MASEAQPKQLEGEMKANGSTSSAEAQVSTPETADTTGTSTSTQTQMLQDEKSNAPTETPPHPRLQALANKKASLESTLSDLQQQKAALVSTSTLPSGLTMPEAWSDEDKATSALATAHGVIKDHIDLLHKYNEIKDIAQGLMGLIAESRGVRQKVVEDEYGMGEGD